MPDRRFGSSQPELIPRSTTPSIPIDPNHRLVRITALVDWARLIDEIEALRRSKVGKAGRRPHLRALLGAMILMAVQRMTYRQAEDQIRHYAPARLLCGLTETTWTPDFTTLQDFAALLGEEGMRIINEEVVRLAAELSLADPKVAAADLTAQEAAIPYPNEMGLMSRFIGSLGKACKKAGGALGQFWGKVSGKVKKAKRKVRAHRLFAKTPEARARLTAQVSRLIAGLQEELSRALDTALKTGLTLRGYAKRALGKACELHETMRRLLPQIRFWLRTGRVARKKVINLHMPEVHAIVRGKAGKDVEFGWKWGFLRVGGGYVLGRPEKTREELTDAKFAVEAVEMHKAVLGEAPESYAYDRGGWSSKNLTALAERGVKNIGLAPRGQASWPVSGSIRDFLVRVRAQVEGVIGALKSPRYAFNKPGARSVAAMKFSGMRSMVGFNLNKLVRDLSKKEKWAMVG